MSTSDFVTEATSLAELCLQRRRMTQQINAHQCEAYVRAGGWTGHEYDTGVPHCWRVVEGNYGADEEDLRNMEESGGPCEACRITIPLRAERREVMAAIRRQRKRFLRVYESEVTR